MGKIRILLNGTIWDINPGKDSYAISRSASIFCIVTQNGFTLIVSDYKRKYFFHDRVINRNMVPAIVLLLKILTFFVKLFTQVKIKCNPLKLKIRV